MGPGAPTPVVIPVHCAPKKAPCPTCGKHGRRKRTFTRTVRTVAYKTVAFLEITCGEYGAWCACCTTFRNSPEGVLPRALYDNKVRDLVLDRILKDGMSIERTLESLSREFLLDLSTGFVYDVLYDHAKQLDMAAHRRTVLALFSGTLCVDELHLGRFTLLVATDPLSDLPVAFALVAANDQGHMRQGNGILSHVLNRTFSRYSSLKAHLSRLVSIPRRHSGSRLSNPRENRRITLRFAAAWPVRTRQASSRKLTSNCQCRWFSIPQWPRTAPANSSADNSRLRM
jgi:hypothetical protein